MTNNEMTSEILQDPQAKCKSVRVLPQVPANIPAVPECSRVYFRPAVRCMYFQPAFRCLWPALESLSAAYFQPALKSLSTALQ